MREQSAERAGVEPAPADGEEERIVGTLRQLRSRLAQVPGEDGRRLLAERDDALLPALAAHAHVLLLEVEVGQVERDRLGAAEAGRVDELDERAVAKAERPLALDAVDQLLHLVPSRRLRQALGPLRRQRRIGNAGGAESEAEQRADGCQLPCDRRRRKAIAGAAELRGVVDENANV